MVNLAMPFLSPKRSRSCPPRLSCRELQWVKMGYQLGHPVIPQPPEPMMDCCWDADNFEGSFQPYREWHRPTRDKEHLWPQPSVWCNCRPPREKKLCDICLKAQERFENTSGEAGDKRKGHFNNADRELRKRIQISSKEENEDEEDIFQDIDDEENLNSNNPQNGGASDINGAKKSQKEILIIYPKDSFYESVERTNQCGSNIIKIHTFVNYEPSSWGELKLNKESPLMNPCPCSSNFSREELENQREDLISVVSYDGKAKFCLEPGRRSAINISSQGSFATATTKCEDEHFIYGSDPTHQNQPCPVQKCPIDSCGLESSQFPSRLLCDCQAPLSNCCHKETQTIWKILDPQFRRTCYCCNNKGEERSTTQNRIRPETTTPPQVLPKMSNQSKISKLDSYCREREIWENPFKEGVASRDHGDKSQTQIQNHNKFQNLSKVPNFDVQKSRIPNENFKLLSANSLQMPQSDTPKSRDFLKLYRSYQNPSCPPSVNFQFSMKPRLISNTKNHLTPSSPSKVVEQCTKNLDFSECNHIPRKSSHVTRRSQKYETPYTTNDPNFDDNNREISFRSKQDSKNLINSTGIAHVDHTSSKDSQKSFLDCLKSQPLLTKIRSFLQDSLEKFICCCSQAFNIHNNYLKACDEEVRSDVIPKSLHLQGTTINSTSTDDDPRSRSTSTVGNSRYLEDFCSSEKFMTCCKFRNDSTSTVRQKSSTKSRLNQSSSPVICCQCCCKKSENIRSRHNSTNICRQSNETNSNENQIKQKSEEDFPGSNMARNSQDATNITSNFKELKCLLEPNEKSYAHENGSTRIILVPTKPNSNRNQTKALPANVFRLWWESVILQFS
ncbi:uncharacterized protein LOC101896473 isoform X2 [Musca domestica]|uniref:Uncharacterized protein LOC101896473 isoform X2 n=1 Tax=Musca domestica TaxID=7370 RepID=A0ABM3VFJ1_MUSDO|nr:uncharacterized protein LOC101896473 isoform X2 [Musca domestica]